MNCFVYLNSCKFIQWLLSWKLLFEIVILQILCVLDELFIICRGSDIVTIQGRSSSLTSLKLDIATLRKHENTLETHIQVNYEYLNYITYFTEYYTVYYSSLVPSLLARKYRLITYYMGLALF